MSDCPLPPPLPPPLTAPGARRSVLLEQLDPANPKMVELYERAFHLAYQRVPTNTLIRDLWKWDDASGRLATRIPYDDQFVFLLRGSEGGIETAIGVNTAMRHFQATAFDFAPPADTTGVCELLTFFTVADGALVRAFRFWEAFCVEMCARGFHTAFATTAPRPLPTYRYMGAEVLETREIAGQQRFLLRFDLNRHWGRRSSRDGESERDGAEPRPRGLENLA